MLQSEVDRKVMEMVNAEIQAYRQEKRTSPDKAISAQ